MKKLYIDQYGKVWKRINVYTVWNPDSGYGGWFDGKGLKQL